VVGFTTGSRGEYQGRKKTCDRDTTTTTKTIIITLKSLYIFRFDDENEKLRVQTMNDLCEISS
jgi:DNA-binding Xre family transcriptional regulator